MSKNDSCCIKIDDLSIQTIRFLAVDGVQKANSGHPGMPMGMAAGTYELWVNHMKHNPKNPKWHNRDRFVLSAGHGSMLLYSMLHLTGYDMSLDDLKNFRQWDSKTPGHPEHEHDSPVEVTTGPLGQGISNAVGMAIAEKYLASQFNKEGFPIFDYKIYVIAGDGCLQEGVSAEACSLAGHLGLNNLIVIYDDNHITIDGDTSLSFTEDVAKRYEAYGWNVIKIEKGNGNDIKAIAQALESARKQDKPTLIKLRTHIGYGSPNKQDSHDAHGSPLGKDEIKLTKERFGWDGDKDFHVPGEVFEHMSTTVLKKGQAAQAAWEQMVEKYKKQYPEQGKQLETMFAGKLPIDIDQHLPKFEAGTTVATRKASGDVLNALMPKLPTIIGGSADLTPSNNTWFKGATNFEKSCPSGRYIRYGVREHAMGAIMNGISVSGLLRAYSATFLVFSDYMRPAIRVAALAKYPSIFIFTHDSIGVGEDGPTHQPVEHAAVLRAIPGLKVFRPADANESAQAWKYALENTDGPVTMFFTRQNLPVLDQTKYGSAANVSKGAYVLIKEDKPDVLLLATGSEVSLAIEAHAKLAKEGIKAQVVSMPCWELFEQQSQAYKDSVIPPQVKARVGIEAGIQFGWEKYLGDGGKFIGMKGFGASAPANICYEKFGITVDKAVEAAKAAMKK